STNSATCVARPPPTSLESPPPPFSLGPVGRHAAAPNGRPRMKKVVLQVVAGQKREPVGRVPASEGMLTSGGFIVRISPAGTLFLDDGSQVRNPAKLTVRHT